MLLKKRHYAKILFHQMEALNLISFGYDYLDQTCPVSKTKYKKDRKILKHFKVVILINFHAIIK